MMLVSMSDPGLIILPTHRLISGLPELRSERLAELLSKHFTLEKVGTGEKGARDAWELIEADGSQALLGFGTVSDGVWQVARFKAPDEMAKLAAPHSETEVTDDARERNGPARAKLRKSGRLGMHDHNSTGDQP